MTPRLTRPWRTLVPVLALLACGPAPDTPPELVPRSTASFGGIAVHPDLIAVFEVTNSASEAVWIRPDIDVDLRTGLRQFFYNMPDGSRWVSLISHYHINTLDGKLRQGENSLLWEATILLFNPDANAAVERVGMHLSYWDHLQSDDRFVIWRGPDGRAEMAEIFLSANIDLDHDLSRFVTDGQSISVLSRDGALHRCDYKAYSNPDLDRGPHDWGHEFSCAPVADPSQAPLPRVGVCVESGEPWRSVLDRLEVAKVQQLNELVLLFNCDQVGFDWPDCETTDWYALRRFKIDDPPTCSPIEAWIYHTSPAD